MTESEMISCLKQSCYKKFIHFLEYLNIDSEEYEYIFDTPIVVDYIKKYELAIYNYDDNMIILNKKDFDKMLKNYNSLISSKIYNGKELSEEECTYFLKYIYDDFCETLMHELMHVNRNIIIHNKLSVSNYEEVIERSISIFKLNKDGYDFNKCRLLLSSILNDDKYKDFLIVPFMLRKDSEKTFVLAYDKKEKAYKEYYLNNNITDIYDIATLLNSNDLKIKEIYDVYKDISHNECFLGCYYEDINFDYSLDFDTFLKIINKKYKQDKKLFLYQTDLEEDMVDLTSKIIINFTGDLNSTISLLKINNKKDYSQKMLLDLFLLHPELIRWFITSIYDVEYKNELYNLFKDNYYTFTKTISKIYGRKIKSFLKENKIKRLYKKV